MLRKLPPKLSNKRTETRGRGDKLADSKFSARAATWISPVLWNFVSKQVVDHVFDMVDRIPKFIRALLISGGRGGERRERELGRGSRHLHLREISAERFVYIGDRVISRSWPKCVGHVGSGTTLENCPHEARGDPPPSSTPGTRFPRAIAQIVYIFKNTRRILFNLFNTYGWIYLVRWTINCSTDLICLIVFIIRQ